MKLLIDKTALEVELNKEQVTTVIENYFKVNKGKKEKENHGSFKVGYGDIVNCLLQYQLKNGLNASHHKGKSTSPEDVEEAV